jgi:hypothetical protein
MCFVCGNSFAASPVNCNVHAFSAGEGGRGAGAFVMMNSSKKHDSVQVLSFEIFVLLQRHIRAITIFLGSQLSDDRRTHAATIGCSRLTVRAIHVAVARLAFPSRRALSFHHRKLCSIAA